MRLTDLLALSHAPRWSTVAHSRPQTVSDHTFRVMVILIELGERLKVPVSHAALTFAMMHDGAEALTGDIPGDFKERLPEGSLASAEKSFAPWLARMPTLTETEARLIKLADRIETFTFIKIFGVGPHATRVTEWCRERMAKLIKDGEKPIVRELIMDILEETDRE